jgi:malate dehydrogenase (oxaloacetate-decarboxylating)(NADP+)
MALSESYRARMFPNSRLKGTANLLVMPDLDAAHIAYNLSRTVSDSVTVGPILMGARKSVHIMTSAATVRRVINMTAIAAVDAQMIEVRDRERNQAND